MTNIIYSDKVIREPWSASTSTSTSPSDTPRPSSAGDEGGIAIVVENPSFLVDPSSAAVQEVASAVGVKKDLEKLKNTANTLKDVLLHAEELQANNPEMKTWLERIKDAMYEADDITDDFSIEALRKKLAFNKSGPGLQKVVIKVSMTSPKSRTRAMKIAISVPGVISAELQGDDKNQIVVIGNGIDSICLTRLVRKKVGYTELVSVTQSEILFCFLSCFALFRSAPLSTGPTTEQ